MNRQTIRPGTSLVLFRCCTIVLAFFIPNLALAANKAVAEDSTPHPAIYSFDEAARRGVVDFVVNPWAKISYDAILANLKELQPGLVNRLGFQYGGITLKKLNYTGDMARRIHDVLPQARIGGGFPENLKADYSETLPCDNDTDMETFSRPALTSSPAGTGGKYYWIDPSLEAAQRYYICVGKAQIRRGFAHLHFEESDNVLKQSKSRAGSLAGYAHVRDVLLDYGKSQGVAVSFSGEPDLAASLPLESIYVPSRFYENTFDTQYRNRITTDVGKRYSYVLSSAIVEHYVGLVPSRTKVMFYIDNFDYRQDDLRRMMELDAPNRRILITRSASAAHQHGAIFIPSLNHCDGCIPPEFVGDPNELLPGGKISYYDAAACSDFQTIHDALEIHPKQSSR